MLPNFENALKNLEREVINIPMSQDLRRQILKEFKNLRELLEKIPTNQS
jgi:hypothetical protein